MSGHYHPHSGGLGDFDTRCRDDINAGRLVGPRILASYQGFRYKRTHGRFLAVAARSI
jgi:hypothetical protein